MRICDSSCSLATSYSRTEQSSVQGQLSVAVSNVHSYAQTAAKPKNETFTLSDQARQRLLGDSGKLNGLANSNTTSAQEGLLKGFLEKLFGTKIGDLDVEQLQFTDTSVNADSAQAQGQASSDSTGSKLALSYSASHVESNQTSLSFEGVVRTKDGQEFDVSVSMSVSKEFVSQTDINYQQSTTPASSPISIDFDGLASELSSMKFAFAPAANQGQAPPDKVGRGLLLLLEDKQDKKPDDGVKGEANADGVQRVDAKA